jgi:L-lactate dehydrogenase complex protein LldG
MKRTRAARSDILRSIRENLAASTRFDALHEHGRVPDAVEHLSAPAGAAELRLRFTERLQAVGAEVTIAHDETEAAAALSDVLQRNGARRVAASGAPVVRRLLQQARGDCVVNDVEMLAQDDLFQCDAGVTTAQWAIAETGTLVLASAHERNRYASLVPRVHVAILAAADICATIGDALARVHDLDDDGTMLSRAVTFITGPSRTSDIELTLVIGVHGPQVLHVIVLDTPASGSARVE